MYLGGDATLKVTAVHEEAGERQRDDYVYDIDNRTLNLKTAREYFTPQVVERERQLEANQAELQNVENARKAVYLALTEFVQIVGKVNDEVLEKYKKYSSTKGLLELARAAARSINNHEALKANEYKKEVNEMLLMDIFESVALLNPAFNQQLRAYQAVLRHIEVKKAEHYLFEEEVEAMRKQTQGLESVGDPLEFIRLLTVVSRLIDADSS